MTPLTAGRMESCEYGYLAPGSARQALPIVHRFLLPALRGLPGGRTYALLSTQYTPDRSEALRVARPEAVGLGIAQE